MNSLTISSNTNDPTAYRSGHPNQDRLLACLDAGPVASPAWNETELTDAIVTVCDEMPSAPMLACWRALDHCRRSIPRGTPESLRAAMRAQLRGDMGIPHALVAAV